MRKPSVSQIIQTTRDIAASFEMQFGPRRARSLQVAGASCIVSAGAGMGKLVMGMISLSLFTCASAFYSFAMVVAKVVALSALVRETGREEQTRFCKLAGRLLVAASALYMLYSARLFWHPVERGFHLYIAIGIAAFTFFELALNIRGVLVERRSRAPLFYSLKPSTSPRLYSILCSPTAALALEAEENYVVVHTHANILIGLLMGGCALLLGVRLILRMKRMASGRDYGDTNRRLRRPLRRAGVEMRWKPACLHDGGEMLRLGVYLPEDARPDDVACLRALARDMLHMELCPLADAPLKEERA